MTTVIMNSAKACIEICKVLDVDPRRVMAITINIKPGVCTFDVQYALSTDAVCGIAGIVEGEDLVRQPP